MMPNKVLIKLSARENYFSVPDRPCWRKPHYFVREGWRFVIDVSGSIYYAGKVGSNTWWIPSALYPQEVVWDDCAECGH